jgi:hypothetical protein
MTTNQTLATLQAVIAAHEAKTIAGLKSRLAHLRRDPALCVQTAHEVRKTDEAFDAAIAAATAHVQSAARCPA